MLGGLIFGGGHNSEALWYMQMKAHISKVKLEREREVDTCSIQLKGLTTDVAHEDSGDKEKKLL